MSKKMDILSDLPDTFRKPAVQLFLDSLGEKIVPAMGHRSRAEALLMDSLNSDACFLAVEGSDLLGMIGLNTSETVFVEAGLVDFLKHAGFFRSLWTLPILGAMEHSTMSDEIYVEMIAVSPTARGQGIGHALLARAEEHGIALGKSRLTLQVVDTNPRAKKLYETLGFRTTGTYNTYPMGRLVGWRFNKVDFMEKTLTSRNRVP